MTELYRHYNSDGELLYIGISLSTARRLAEHRCGSRWFKQIARIEIQHFSTRGAALNAERRAIELEKTKYNGLFNELTAEPSEAPQQINGEAAQQPEPRQPINVPTLPSFSLWEKYPGRAVVAPEELAELLGVGDAAIYECIQRGEIKILRFGKPPRIPIWFAEDFLARVKAEEEWLPD